MDVNVGQGMQLPALRRGPPRDRPLSRSNATQHKAIGDYGDQRRIVRRVTIDGPVSAGIDGRHGKRRNGDAQVAAAA
jgi:taurine dioxygenase